MFQQNESDHLDLIDWLDTLERLGVNLAKEFPSVVTANERVDRLEQIRSEHLNTRRDINVIARQIGNVDDLTDSDPILSTADHFAYSQDEGHRARVTELLDCAADFARGNAVRRFKHTDVLHGIRPAFDTVAARIVEAATVIPEGVINLEDAARVGHADTYLQLEKDLNIWAELTELIEAWISAGVFGPEYQTRYPTEFMVEDALAHREAAAGLGRPTRRAAAIAAGKPNLHTPIEAHIPPADPKQDELAAYKANDADRAAREDLGLVSK